VLVNQPPEALDRDLGILVLSEHVLKRDHALDQGPRFARIQVGQELERVPEALAPDAHAVVRVRGRPRLDLRRALAKRLEAALDQVRGNCESRKRRRARAASARRSEQAGEATDEHAVPARVEVAQHRLPGDRPLPLEQRADRGKRIAIGLGNLREPLVELFELDIEIADGSERAADPAKIVREGRR